MKKKTKKESREFRVLMSLLDLYLKTGKPVGSHTLKEQGFHELSSATIRNYFAELEKLGYLRQPHASGGRVPTEAAFRFYAEEHLQDTQVEPETEEQLLELVNQETRHLTSFLQKSIELLSDITGLAVFLSSVRFDHDFIQEVRLMGIDHYRILFVLMTDFGQIYTEVISSDHKLSSFALKRIESYFHYRLKGQNEPDRPIGLSEAEELTAKKFYNEIMVRYLVRYSNFSDEEVYRTGFSKLLAYPEFNDPIALTGGLSLFENTSHMRLLLNDCTRGGELRYWIGGDLTSYAVGNANCSVLAIPYRINQIPVGAIGILGPCRMPYQALFGILRMFSDSISKALAKSLYTHKLTFRHARSGSPYVMHEERLIVDQTSHKLIEVKE